MSHRSEAVAEAAFAERADASLWQQLYFLSTRAETLDFVRRVERAGYSALVVTVDAAVGGLRERGVRANFAFPEDVRWENADVSPSDWAASAATISPKTTWDDVAWLVKETALPVVVKGVLSPADAVQAAACGAHAVIVSNHGGRQLDDTPSTAAALSHVAAALRDTNVEVLVDGGIRRGSDVVKALALGATAVLVGRPVLYGLAVDGPRACVETSFL